MASTSASFDAEYVRSYLQKFALDPVPTGEPAAVTDADGYRLTAEVYSWGRVFFAEHRARGLGYTWIERGDERPELPGWVRLLRDRVDPPGCFGWWRPSRECDGTRTEPPCVFRGRCIALQRRALSRRDTSRTPLDPAKYTARLARVRTVSPLSVLDADLARHPAPPLPSEKVSPPSAPDPAEEGAHAMTIRFMHAIGALGGWPVHTKYRASVGSLWFQEGTFRDRGTTRRSVALYWRKVTHRARANTDWPTSVGVLRAYVTSSGFNARIWTDHLDIVNARLKLSGFDLEARPLAKDRARLSVAVTVSSDEEAAAVAAVVVYLIQADLLCSRGATPPELAPNRGEGTAWHPRRWGRA